MIGVKFRILISALSGGVLGVAMLLFSQGVAHAAGTFTWTGGGSDGNWSTAANWAGAVAPAGSDTGDNIVIDNSATFTNGCNDDVAGLTIASLTFENVAVSGTVSMALAQPLTIAGPIVQLDNDTSTVDEITDASSAETLTLGADVNVTDEIGMIFGDTGSTDTLALNGYTITFGDNGVSKINGVNNIIAVYYNITGSGGVIYDGAATDYQLYGDNTYSGTTQVAADDDLNNPAYTNAFGTSSITVGTAGSIVFYYTGSTSINNPITITGTTTGTPISSLAFESTAAGDTFTVPNITLNGNTRFNNLNGMSTPPTALTVNLASINVGSHCIAYIGSNTDETNGTANGFTNGPVGCTFSSSTTTTKTAPKTPDTGTALVKSQPLMIIAGFVVVIAGLFGITKIVKNPITTKRR